MLREGEIVFPRKEYNNWLFITKCSAPPKIRINIVETGCIQKYIYIYIHTCNNNQGKKEVMKLTESKGHYIEAYGKRKRRGKLFKFIIISKGKSKIKNPTT